MIFKRKNKILNKVANITSNKLFCLLETFT